MPVQIQNPQAWAKVNSYTLRPQDEKFINVSFQGQAVGLLTKVGDYFEFQPIDMGASPEEKNEQMRKQMFPHCHVRATLCCVYADDGKIAIVYAIVPFEGVDKLLCHYSSP